MISSKTKTLIFFAVIALIFCFLLLTYPGFAGADAFFHIKISTLMKENLNITEFPWLQHTIHKITYAESSFFYHFVPSLLQRFLDPFTAQKVFMVFLNTALAAAFFLFLKKQQIKAPLIWTLVLLFSSSQFLFRINLARPISLSIIILLAASWLLFNKKYLWLSLLSFLYVWSYNAFPLILVLGIIYVFSEFIAHRKINIKPLLSITLGLFAGMVLHPSFPANFKFYYTHLLVIPFTNGYSQVSVGAEWLPPLGKAYLLGSGILLFVWLFSLIAIKNHFSHLKKNPRIIFLVLSSIMFFIAMLKSQRFIEYFAPFGVITAALTYSLLSPKIAWEKIKGFLERKHLFHLKRELYAAGLILALAIVVSSGRSLQQSASAHEFYGASQYLLAHSKPGEIVYNTAWDQFPQLFFWNSHNYYISGMDPVFMFVINEKKYWLYTHLFKDQIFTCDQKYCVNDFKRPYKILKEEFNASFVFLENKRTLNLKKYFDGHEKFRKVYEDNETSLYEIL